jgi:GTP-binding protein HflX
LVNLKRSTPAFYTGQGKAEEISELAKEHHIDVIVFYFALYPGKQCNLEELAGLSAIDSQDVILEVFAD